MAEVPFEQVAGQDSASGEIPFEQAHAVKEVSPQATKEVPFEGVEDMTPPDSGQLVDPTQDQQPMSLGGNPITNPYQTQALNPFASAVLDQTSKSAVGKTMEILSGPARLEASAVIKASAMLGVPRGKELESTLNPEHRWFPDVYLSDVLDFYDDGTESAKEMRNASTAMKGMYYTSRAGVGFGLNVLADPLNLLTVGTYTRAAQEIQKVGNEINPLTEVPRIMEKAAHERNLLAMKVPFSGGKEIGLVPMKAVDPTIEALKRVPGVDTLAGLLKKLSPDTGYKDVDLASSGHAALGRGAAENVLNRFVIPYNQASFTPDEHKIISTLVERTANMKPNLPERVLKAAGPKLSGEEGSLKKQMATILENHDLLPGRGEKLIDAAIDIKRMGGAYLETMYRAGHLDETNVAAKVIENHLPHVVDPNYRGIKLTKAGVPKSPDTIAEELLSKQKVMENQAQSVIKGSFLSATDPTRYRSMTRGLTLPEANAKVMSEYGIKDFFVSNPIHASAIRLLEANKLERDKYLLDTIARYGERLKSGEKPAEGFSKIDHPQFNDKTIIIANPMGGSQKILLRDMVFPKEIAEKMSYYLNPPAVGNIKAQFNQLNRIFRSTSFLSPGFWIRNSADNTVKNIVQGVTPQTHLDTLKLLTGKLAGLQAEGNIVNPRGKLYSAEELNGLLSKWGINSGNAFHDGAADFMGAGKKLTLSQAASSPRKLGLKYTAEVADSMLRGVSKFGERGENFTRSALFLQRLKEGYTPEMAAREVTKYLFDYTRNSPLTNSARFWMPFIQHPMKTLLVAPELIGKSMVTYNTLHNSLPHVLAAAFHDPIQQHELNQILPDYLKQRDVVAGPLLTGNSYIYDMLVGSRPQKAQTKMGGVIYFDPAVGMRILNHFAHPVDGLAPIWRAAFEAISGHDRYGRSLDNSTVGEVDPANRLNHFISQTLEGTVAYHNAWNMMKTAFGLKNPEYADTPTLSLMKGAFGQFGGVTNLDKEFMFKQIALGSQIKELEKNLRIEVGRETRNMAPTGSLGAWVHTNYGEIVPENPLRTYKSIQARVANMQGAQAAAQGLQGQIGAKDYVERIKAVHEAMQSNIKAYQFSVGRYLQMAKDAKSKAEARDRAGVDH